MDETRLREELEDIPVPEADAAERRAWELVAAAYEDRPAEVSPARRRHRPVVAAAMLAALGAVALALTPAGAAVTDWIGETLDPGRDDAKPALTRLPAAGQLLVTSDAGAWIVRDDGSRRLLGDYDEATWSPHARYVAVAQGRELSAVDPRGQLRWSISRRRISDPRWSPNEGFRVAYLSGGELRVVWGDGTNDRALAPAAPVAPAWQPRTGARNLLAYVDPRGRVRLVDADSGRGIAAGPRVAAPVELHWSSDGSRLLLLSRSALRVLDPAGTVVARTRFAPGLEGVAAAFRPGSTDIVTIRRSVSAPVRSAVVLTRYRSGHDRDRPLFTGVGRFEGLAYSPDGRRLLVGWRDADQWLFLPSGRAGRVETVGNLARQFDSGRVDGPASFPLVEGWCCRAG
jgi:hypothetical protein